MCVHVCVWLCVLLETKGCEGDYLVVCTFAPPLQTLHEEMQRDSTELVIKISGTFTYTVLGVNS